MYTLFLLYCTYCTYCTYCAKGRILYVLYTIVHYIVRYFVQNCILLLRTKLYIIVHYCTVYVQNCTLSGPRSGWRGARLLPRRLAGLIPLLVLLRPIPAAAPRRFSSNALPFQITTARFTFQNHRCDDLRRRAQGSWPPPAAAAQAASARPSSAVELRKAWT